MDENFDINENEELVDEEITEVISSEDKADDGKRTEVVGVRFKKSGKTYYFAPAGFMLKLGQAVIVDTSRGQEYGFIAMTNREVKNSELSDPLRSVIRIATEDDAKAHSENKKKEIEAFNACICLIDKHKLQMKLIDTELSFDRTKMLFYFSSESRVDFRELVRDLASSFHTRIEMRQIGIRDEAKILGGLGICGRPYCCSTFLSDFGQVSVKMAKEQNLSLNTSKISGSCGRLMCCLRYEYDTYLAEKALTPKVDTRVMTPNGAGVVVAANPLAGIVKVHLDSQGEGNDSVMFVREDVVEESKYEGQKLTKTDIPKRGEKPDDIPSFAEFSTSESTSTAPKTEISVSPVEPQTVAGEEEKSEPQNQNQNGEHRHKKHKRKKHKGGNGQNNGNAQGGAQQKNGNSPKQNAPKNNQNGEIAQPKAPQENQNGAAQGGQSNKKKKKKFFHHHGKNKNGQGSQGGSPKQ